MGKKQKFKSPYIGIEEIDGIPVFYTERGDFSVVLKVENPIIQFSGDIDAYYDFHQIFSNILKILGAGYSIQKQDILSRKLYNEKSPHEDFLSQKYFSLFQDRPYVGIDTYLIITREVDKSKFFKFDYKKFKEFFTNTKKIVDLFKNKGIKARIFKTKKEVDNYIRKFFNLNFGSKETKLNNIKANDNFIEIGDKFVKSISLVDIDEVNFPSEIKPYKEVNVGVKFPVDLLSFMMNIPDVDTVVYNQIICIPEQQKELNKLEAKKRKHKGIPDPANTLCVVDIEKVQEDIARNGQMLVYVHYNILLSGRKSLNSSINYTEGELFNCGIIPSRQDYNQLELFECALPGNIHKLKNYDRYLTTSDSAICLLFKERMYTTEKSSFLTYMTDRRGIPIGIDFSGKEGEKKFTTNGNKFVLGPSGSGKSFFMNAMIRQYTLENTDVILVDTGHSYSGICEYYKGKYITYTEEKPITMNPFKIKETEYNEEKREFLKSLICALWKGTEGSINQVEDTLLSNVIKNYYHNYFVTQEIKILNFNSFYEFAIEEIKRITESEGITFDLKSFQFILKKFYKGGEYDRILNDDMDKSLFDEKFIVFEIDAIKDHKIIFPVVTLIIIDIFIQKMRLKKNRKVLIIEEAWKAIASPMMAGFIVFLYKTVRKFWGEAIVVTQELDDIIGNELVKSSIVNNSDVICLLDQAKFKDNYDEIASLLNINEVEKKKVFTINKLNNTSNRNPFKEVYVKRGDFGTVLGVEVSLHEYFTFTTERIEKDTLALYNDVYENSFTALDKFVNDFIASKLSKEEWVITANKVLSSVKQTKALNSLKKKENLLEYILNY